jgi:hypothetical protein
MPWNNIDAEACNIDATPSFNIKTKRSHVYQDETKSLDLFKDGQYWLASSMSTGVQNRVRPSGNHRVVGSHPWDQWTKLSGWEPCGEWLTTADVY